MKCELCKEIATHWVWVVIKGKKEYLALCFSCKKEYKSGEKK